MFNTPIRVERYIGVFEDTRNSDVIKNIIQDSDLIPDGFVKLKISG